MRIIRFLVTLFFIIGVIGSTATFFAGYLMYQNLPELTVLTNYRPKIPLRIYASDGSLIAEFGEERRDLVKIKDVPLKMKQAILAAEDERFYEHVGVDFIGLGRAFLANVISRGAKEGASTITMQVARNFYLSTEKTLTRKFSEILLSFKIENNLTKDQILEIYLNQIYLGQKAYGFGSAAHMYYGKPIDKLSIAEMAMLAGLPKAPSKYNPVVNPERSKTRQQYVLKRMKTLNFLTQQQYDNALNEQLNIKGSTRNYAELQADYVAEMVRLEISKKYSKDIYNSGLKVYTTIDKKYQEYAQDALWRGVFDYDQRHGYRGIEDLYELPPDPDNDTLETTLAEFETVNFLIPAIVLDVKSNKITVYARGMKKFDIKDKGLRFAKSLRDSTRKIQRGAIIRIYEDGDAWSVGQLPEVESALVALDPENGNIKALVGGFNYNRNKFNHVTQASRQPGSSIKPFIYSAALDNGMTAGDYISDSPININGWEPKNYDGSYSGPVSMRKALTKSKNLVTIRIMQQIGLDKAREHLTKFGFDLKNHPAVPTIVLGAGQTTPLELAGGYTVFANGGYKVIPHIIDYITDSDGKELYREKVPVVGNNAQQILDPRNAFITTSMMKDVVKMGTAAQAGKELKRVDLAGKTGTTNDQHDAWFAGFNPKIVAVAWMGYDKPRNLGEGETGGHTALPIWIKFMKKVLEHIPVVETPVPANLVQQSGEYFYAENVKVSRPPAPKQENNEENLLNNESVNDILSGGQQSNDNREKIPFPSFLKD